MLISIQNNTKHAMQSPWLTDERSNNDHNHHRGQQQVPEYDFTAGFERSTSAPPPETSLLFGSSRSSNENVGTGVKSILSPSFLPDNQYVYSGTARHQQQHQLQHQFQHQQLGPPGFVTNGSVPSSSPTNVNATISNAHFLDNHDHRGGGGGGSLVRTQQVHDRQTIGETQIRPHSATPSFDSSLSVGLPPGLSSRQETPPLSNRSSGGVRRGSYTSTATNMISGSDMYHLEDITFTDRSQILHLGQRRSASTGVIGGIHHQEGSSSVLRSLGLGSGIAVRPAAKTLMDLIQEDYPREPYGEQPSSVTPPHHGGGLLYDTTAPREATTAATTSTVFQNHQRDAAYALERPRTTSPLSSQHMREHYDYMYGRSNNNDLGYGGDGIQRSIDPTRRGGNDTNNNNNNNNILDPMNRLNLGIGDTSPYRTNNNTVQSRHVPQYATADSRPQGESKVQGSMYAPVTYHPQPSRPQAINPGQHPQYDPQGGGRGGGGGGYRTQPQQIQTHIQTQVLPSGQTVYVNTAQPPSQYGYATIQYHPHPQQQQQQQQHAAHQTVPGEQYISVVPIQGGGQPPGHVQNVGPGGSYAYWQPPNGQHQGGPQHTVTMIPPTAAGIVPMNNVSQRIGESKSGAAEPQQQRQKQRQATANGGRGKEKNGKGRRNNNSGATPARRGGGGGGGGGSGGGGSGGGNGEIKSNTSANLNPNPNASLLEDYKAKKNIRDWTVNDVKGHVVEFCQDQNGSRFIQQRLELGDDNEKEIVVAEVLPEVERLRNDVFGNYVVQKLWGFGTEKMKEDLRDTMIGEIVQLSMQMYGCRVVQKCLECVDEIDLPKLLSEFQNNVLSLIHDQNGNHVIQKCIEVMSLKAKAAREENEEEKALFFSEQIDFVVGDVLDNLSTLACHPYGCRVLQRVLEYCVENQKSMALEKISQCLRTLFDDQYGNYVIQHVLQFGRVKDRDMVLEMVVNNGLLKLSRQKFASNVVEKLLKYGNAEQRISIVREMLRIVNEKTDSFVEDGEEGTSVVLLMVRDPYANYVVQTTLDVVPDSEEKIGLLKELNAHSTELKNYTFAKHIITKLDS